MTVAELIGKLDKVEDKNKRVVITGHKGKDDKQIRRVVELYDVVQINDYSLVCAGKVL